MQRNAKQRKSKQRKAKRSSVVCRSICQCPIFKPQLAGFGWRARFAPSAPPRLALPLFSSPLLSYFFVYDMSRTKQCNEKQSNENEKQSKEKQRKAKKSKEKQRKAKQRYVVCRSVCQRPILKPQQLAGFMWHARFAPSAHPRVALFFLSSPLRSFLIFACV